MLSQKMLQIHYKTLTRYIGYKSRWVILTFGLAFLLTLMIIKLDFNIKQKKTEVNYKKNEENYEKKELKYEKNEVITFDLDHCGCSRTLSVTLRRGKHLTGNLKKLKSKHSPV